MAMLALAACGEEKSPPAPAVSPAGVLTPEWVYTPANDDTRLATGALTIVPGIGPEGPIRALQTERGDRLDAVLAGEIDPRARAGIDHVTETLARRPGARALVYSVSAGNLCLGAQSTHVVWYEPEMIEGRALALALLAGAPGESGSTVCRVLRYTRERSPQTAAAVEDEDNR
jgi:hypothetical protein